MTITDSLHYIAVGNPLSKAVIGTTASLFRTNSSAANMGTVKAAAMNKGGLSTMPPLWQLAGRSHNFVRLAGLSGAAAVILGAVGSHYSNFKDNVEMRTIFDTANRFHFFHSIALLGMPLAKYPLLSGSLMLAGTVLFSGCLYYRAFTGNKPPFARMAPMGGTCLIIAWLSLLL